MLALPAQTPTLLRTAAFAAAFMLAALPAAAQSAAPKKPTQVSPAPTAKTNITHVAKSTPEPRPQTTAIHGRADKDSVKTLVSHYAQRHGVPETLAHRIVAKESGYNPTLKGRAHFGLMQVSLPTAKQMGYAGAPQGLLDARTNLAYGMPYLANAWIVSGGSEARALSLYTRGYYYDAKRKNLLKALRTARSAPVQQDEDETVAVVTQ